MYIQKKYLLFCHVSYHRIAMGAGKSKKEAKHAAAKALIEKLTEKLNEFSAYTGNQQPSKAVVEFAQPAKGGQMDSSIDGSTNYDQSQ